MALIAQKNINTLGIDIGSHTIKLVELARRGEKVELVTYGGAELDRSNLGIDPQKNIDLYADALRRLIAQSRTTTTRTAGALPATSAFTTVLELPVMPKKEIDSAVRWEAKKMIPLPMDKMSLDWHVISTTEKTMSIIITAASREVINGTMAVYKEAGLKLIGLETEISALGRSLYTDPNSTAMILDLGAINTNVVIFHRGVPAMTRNIDAGGQTVDVNITNSMNVNAERTEQFKTHFGLPMGNQPEHPVSKAIQFVIDNILLREIRPMINSFEREHQVNIQPIILAGGTAHLINLAEYLTKMLGKEVVVGNPFARISSPAELTPELEKIGPEMAVAIGLAMKKG